MTTLSEGDLRLTLPASVNGRKFDDEQHGLSHCMKAVDWILELPERFCFIEIKDPDAPGARDHGNRNDFLRKFLSGELTGDLVVKFRAETLFARIVEQEGARLPSDRRYAARLRTPAEGVTIPRSLHDTIQSLRHP